MMFNTLIYLPDNEEMNPEVYRIVYTWIVKYV